MATPPPITVDLPATRRRIIRLNRYVEQHLLQQNRFICRSCSACRRAKRPSDEFRTGTMGHVGKRFDLTMGGKPLRIVIVGQEAKDSKVSPQKRYEQARNGSGRDRRYYADGEHPSRNPHMRGTTSALRLIFGTGLGSDYEGEFVHPQCKGQQTQSALFGMPAISSWPPWIAMMGCVVMEPRARWHCEMCGQFW